MDFDFNKMSDEKFIKLFLVTSEILMLKNLVSVKENTSVMNMEEKITAAALLSDEELEPLFGKEYLLRFGVDFRSATKKALEKTIYDFSDLISKESN